MEEQAYNPGTNPAATAENQLQQVRQAVAKQVAELKQQIQLIQQQSLKTMQDTIDAVFKTQASDNLQQVARQEQDTLQQIKNVPAAAPGSPAASGYTEIPDGNQAMAIAGQSVEQAMQSAAQSVENAEKALSNLGTHQLPGAQSTTPA